MTVSEIANFGYIISMACFALSIKRLGKIKSARSANLLAASAMLIAVVSQLLETGLVSPIHLAVGLLIGSAIGVAYAQLVQMTAMPQLVAIFNGFGGLASTCVAMSLVVGGAETGVTLILSLIIGTVTFSGSLIAFAKLSDTFGSYLSAPLLLPGRHFINGGLTLGLLALSYFWLQSDSFTSTIAFSENQFALSMIGLTLVFGVLLVIPIGGADMPVVVSLLNSYSGIAAAASGFALNSNILIVSGALVGASGMILTQIMCRGMNRSLANVMFGGFGAAETAGAKKGDNEYKNVKSSDTEEAALDLESVQSVVIVPGYGLAVAQGQNAVRDLADELKARGCKVRYAIHPVAGRMPGHMNVLLAESKVPYDELYEMDAINNDFKETDICIVVGANDVVNPDAKDDSTSPLYGMPVLNVEESKMVFVIKRSLSPGFAGVKNSLFEKDNCRMVYGDAKKILEEMSGFLAESSGAKAA